MNYHFSENIILRTPAGSYPSVFNEHSIINHFQKKTNQEALYMASPVLYEELLKWEGGKLSAKEEEKFFQSLYKYYTRMQSRCTPYGLFAGCSTGKWGNENKVTLSNFQRHTRLDMHFLCNLAQHLAHNNTLKRHLVFFPNSSIYPVGDQLRYVEYTYVNNRRVHQISSVDNNPYLKNILKLAENGASLPQVTGFLTKAGITPEEASGYIEELVSAQLLLSELEPAVTGKEFTHQLIEKLTMLNLRVKSEEVQSLISILGDILLRLETADKGNNGEVTPYKDIVKQLHLLNVPVDEKILFQTDLFRNTTEACLDKTLQNELLKTIRFLNKITPAPVETNLSRFVKNYIECYEDAEMPVLQVLDTETGIGYLQKDTQGVNVLLEKLYVPPVPQNGYDWKIDSAIEVLFKKLLAAHKNNMPVIQLFDEDFKDVNYATESFPPTMSVMFKVVNAKTNKFYLQNCGGSSGINIIGRFAHGNKDIEGMADAMAEYEQELSPEQILAEIIHLPENRTGNILLRPVFRKHEIPYLAASAVEKKYQLPLDDLYIKIRNGKVVLISKKLNREIIPRLSNMHNFSYNSLPVYQFLCDLQTQYYQKTGLGFGWGNLSRLFPFTPRVEYGNAILEPATWNFFKNDFKEILETDSVDFEEKINTWKKRWNMPSLICLSDGDNELLIDLDDKFSASVLAKTIRNRNNVKLTEFLFDRENVLVKDENKHIYTHECIAFLLQNKENNTVIPGGSTLKTNNPAQRSFMIGDEWLYYKIYCGIKTADIILTRIIDPLMSELANNQVIDNWFFIRYNDPEFHIRLRLKVKDLHSIGLIINKININLKPFLEEGIISRVLTDTYKRELERYGNNTIDITEYFFYQDSCATLEMLKLVLASGNENIRWLYALRRTDDLLKAFSFDLEQRQRFIEPIRDAFFSEHGGEKELKIQLGNKYREHKNQIGFFFIPSKEHEISYTDIFSILNSKTLSLQEVAKDIKLQNDTGAMEVSITSLLSSYIHMMLNRIFVSRPRTNELVVYDMLNKYYKSQIARINMKNNNNPKILTGSIL